MTTYPSPTHEPPNLQDRISKTAPQSPSRQNLQTQNAIIRCQVRTFFAPSPRPPPLCIRHDSSHATREQPTRRQGQNLWPRQNRALSPDARPLPPLNPQAASMRSTHILTESQHAAPHAAQIIMLKTAILLALAFAAPSFAARNLADCSDDGAMGMDMDFGDCPNPPEGTTVVSSMTTDGVTTCSTCPTGETASTTFPELSCTCSGGASCGTYTP